MSEFTNEENQSIKENLEYLKLDLNEIPEFLKENFELDFRPSKTFKEGLNKVYKSISISDIEILLTPTNRLNTLSEKYSKAKYLSSYLEPIEEEDIMCHATFLNMVKNMNVQEIEEVDKLQEGFKKELPYKVKYKLNYLWQIYYSENTNKYFMLVPTEDLDYTTFFYILKKKIEIKNSGEEQKVFVPINYVDYSREYLKKSEFEDIEKYLWLFTKDWPLVYEVYDFENNMNIQIVGETEVYEKIKSIYKISLNNKEEAIKFYKLIKALFILQTEFPHYYDFAIEIGEKGNLEFFFNGKEIVYDNLSELIKFECEQAADKIKELYIEEDNLSIILTEYNIQVKKKEKEYNLKKRQIATYLECKRTFLGKIKYYFKAKKIVMNNEEEENVEDVKNEKEIENIAKKEFYTIEDLLEITKKMDIIFIAVKNTKLDIKAVQYKIEELQEKIKLTDYYLEEIKEHRKNIFDFWKFTNKKELGLNEGKAELEEKESGKKLEKVFDYEEDFESFGIKLDKKQRNILTKNECDALFLATTEQIKYLNMIKNNELNIDKDLEISLVKLKNEAEKERILFNSEDFDIFGAVSEDKTKIKTLGSKKHREIEKDKIQVLDINKNTILEDYKEILVNSVSEIGKVFEKAETYKNISMYTVCENEFRREDFNVFNINPQNALKKVENLEKVDMYRVNLKDEVPLIGFSNIIYFDNKNQTLPVGMDMGDEILLDVSRLEITPKKSKLFRINQEIDDINIKTKIMCLYEYDVVKKK